MNTQPKNLEHESWKKWRRSHRASARADFLWRLGILVGSLVILIGGFSLPHSSYYIPVIFSALIYLWYVPTFFGPGQRPNIFKIYPFTKGWHGDPWGTKDPQTTAERRAFLENTMSTQALRDLKDRAAEDLPDLKLCATNLRHARARTRRYRRRRFIWIAIFLCCLTFFDAMVHVDQPYILLPWLIIIWAAIWTFPPRRFFTNFQQACASLVAAVEKESGAVKQVPQATAADLAAQTREK